MNQPRNQPSLSDAQRFFALLARPGDVYELRGLVKVQGQQHVNTGYFDDLTALAAAAVERSGKDDGVYVTINPVNPALLARAPKNRVRRAGNGDTTSDRDVRTRRSILVDIDPVRPTGISSTQDEHVAAIAMAERIRSDLRELGWPDPIFADSGNGAHLIYAVDLPVDDGGLVKRVLEQLSKRYSTPELKVDEKVFNPARISKIYGTLTRKGEDTAERPHRVARIIDAPATLVDVARERIEALAPVAPAASRTNGQRDYKPEAGRPEFDLDAWIARYLPDAVSASWSEGRKWLLPVCPFNDQHDRKEAYIAQKHSGMIAAGCQHESCFKTWKQLRERFEPDAYERQNGNGQLRPFTNREPPPEVLYVDQAYQDEINTFADRDREPPPKPKPVWRSAPELVDAIWERKDDPWVGLRLLDEEICRVRAGGIVVVMGPPGGGKSSLVSNILLDHAREVGPAIAVSIELPADELAARIVGIQCDASWESVLRGQLPYTQMQTALAVPRLYVIDRKNATVENLRKCVEFVRGLYPGQPILSAIDYTQLLQSKEREVRLRVADSFAQIDDASRDLRIVSIAVSQMSRAGADAARSGEKIGAESASLGAESSAIERFATVTVTIGKKGEPREDGSAEVELSVGKSRMGGGDVVLPATYWGKSGKWRIAGEATSATIVRESRNVERTERMAKALENQLIGAAQKATSSLSREQLLEQVTGRKANKKIAIAALLSSGDLVEVNRRAPRSRSFTVWTPDRARDAGIQLVRDMPDSER
jgi:hypothetical protein